MRYKGFAVFDLETTGLFPGGNDRIVEIGLALSDPDGHVTETWETVVNPGRDLGPTRIHGLRGVDMRTAPAFTEIADEFRELISGRTLVAHNASFDARFLISEWQRADLLASGVSRLPYMCTMQLASRLIPGAGRTLGDCCAAFDIVNPHAHSAMADARATAELLENYLTLPSREELLATATELAFDVRAVASTGKFGSPVPRTVSPASGEAPLVRVLDRLPNEALTESERDYLALLDKCLADDIITAEEQIALDRAAEALLVSRQQRNELHVAYFNNVSRTAWEDGALTERERVQLVGLAKVLHVNDSVLEVGLQRPSTTRLPDADPADGVLSMTNEPHLGTGSMVVLTGDMRRSRAEWTSVLESTGYVVHPAVTKKVKLVVAADPDSLSGKARKARQYGIPIVSEDWLESSLPI